MKTTRWAGVTLRSLLLVMIATSVSCVTSYDRFGRPVQTVDPGMAVAGVAAAGVIGYALAGNNHHGHHHYRPHYGGGHHCR